MGGSFVTSLFFEFLHQLPSTVSYIMNIIKPKNTLKDAAVTEVFLKKNQSFSLLELLTVISILAVIAGTLMTSYGDFESQASEATTRSRLQQIRQALLQFKKDTGSFPGQKQFSLRGVDDSTAQKDFDDLYVPALSKIKTSLLVGDTSSRSGRELLEGVLSDSDDIKFRQAWFDSVINFHQLFEEPHKVQLNDPDNPSAVIEGKGEAVMPWSKRYKRGWNGPYLQKGGYSLCSLSISEDILDSEGFLQKDWKALDVDADTFSLDVPAIADSFPHQTVEKESDVSSGLTRLKLVFFEWRSRFMNNSEDLSSDSRQYISKKGRPIVLAKLKFDDPDYADGYYLISFGANGNFNYGLGDDLILAMPEMN